MLAHVPLHSRIAHSEAACPKLIVNPPQTVGASDFGVDGTRISSTGCVLFSRRQSELPPRNHVQNAFRLTSRISHIRAKG